MRWAMRGTGKRTQHTDARVAAIFARQTGVPNPPSLQGQTAGSNTFSCCGIGRGIPRLELIKRAQVVRPRACWAMKSSTLRVMFSTAMSTHSAGRHLIG